MILPVNYEIMLLRLKKKRIESWRELFLFLVTDWKTTARLTTPGIMCLDAESPDASPRSPACVRTTSLISLPKSVSVLVCDAWLLWNTTAAVSVWLRCDTIWEAYHQPWQALLNQSTKTVIGSKTSDALSLSLGNLLLKNKKITGYKFRLIMLLCLLHRCTEIRLYMSS